MTDANRWPAERVPADDAPPQQHKKPVVPLGTLDRRYYAIGSVIEGYSVKDAADILGIPKRRVWELIARGVLASSPEGPAGVRVYLQPQAPPVQSLADERTTKADEPEPPRHNGNGDGSHEMSPFRELLTEFRNLTERYGQALLALGEARGEVAALRTRVELLEARMDLRLPSTRTASTVAWEIPTYDAEPEAAPEPFSTEGDVFTEPMSEELEQAAYGDEPPDAVALEPELVEPVEPTVEAVFVVEPEEPGTAEEPQAAIPPEGAAAAMDVEEESGITYDLEPPAVEEVAEAPTAEAESPEEPEPEEPARQTAKERRAETRRRRIRGGRTALVGIAEALARADDPTLAELPGAEDAAQALAALRSEMEAAREAAASSEQAASAEPAAELAEAEPTQRADSPYSTEIVEPDWFADGDFSWLDAAQAEATQAEATEGGESPAAEASHAEAAGEAAAMETGTEEVGIAQATADESAIEVVVEDDRIDSDEPSGPEPFEPSAEAVAIADQEARTAIQDAFEEPAPVTRDVVFDEDADRPVHDGEPESSAIQDAFEEPAVTQDVVFGEDADRPVHDGEPESSAIQDATTENEAPEPWPGPTSEELEAEAKRESEAIQDAFGEVTEPQSWPVAQEVEEPATHPELEIAPVDEPEEAPAAEATSDVDAASPPEEFVASQAIEPEVVTSMPPPPGEQELPAAGQAATARPAGPAAPAAPAGQDGEEELMWLGDEFEEASLEMASQGWRSPETSVHTIEAAPVLELSDAELSQLAEDEGWDMAEVEAIRSLLGRTSEAPTSADVAQAEPEPDPPGDESPPQAEILEPADEDERPVVPAAETVRPQDLASAPTDEPPSLMAEPPMVDPPVVEPPMVEPPSHITSPARSALAPMSDPTWLRGRRGPAATAYRRLRRLFPN